MASLALLIFCAVISGWTAALAQIRVHDLPGGTSFQHQQHQQHQRTVSAHDHHPDEARCSGDQAECHHGSKGIHPMACAACFAIETAALDIEPPRIAGTAPEIVPQPAMIATDLKPRFPPPRRFFHA
ncbi:hypothetical protein [Pararhizobium antarcticum]|uniref:Cobalt transporter n=1 Tax=Pararhizobium antarcticum TaxID=1798805 RepID=A0A657LX61_9HYPH|nr:hypothetical protein [Pararhizobium antarcticum]OJF90364.1 hypothetical protein AX761_06755 [Rhizobium sp. 58]OJG00574.1 hypothetical protein AX760_10435 [Pararhizobium antarcticum]